MYRRRGPNQVSNIENAQNGGGRGGESIDSGRLQKQVDEITAKLKHTDIATDPKMTSTTMVIGGLTD